MLWVHKDIEAEQMLVLSLDMTMVLLWLLDQVVLVALVYVPYNRAQELEGTMGLLKRMMGEVWKREGT